MTGKCDLRCVLLRADGWQIAPASARHVSGYFRCASRLCLTAGPLYNAEFKLARLRRVARNSADCSSRSSPITNTLKALRDGDSAARSKSLLSNKAIGILPSLRDLEPRLLEGLPASELKRILAQATYR
jgi:hypothetical protein